MSRWVKAASFALGGLAIAGVAILVSAGFGWIAGESYAPMINGHGGIAGAAAAVNFGSFVLAILSLVAGFGGLAMMLTFSIRKISEKSS